MYNYRHEKEKDKIDRDYAGRHEGFTYTGGGYYERDDGGSDMWVERDRDGNIIAYHRTM